MSGTITRRPRAESDLVDIWSYIADENEAAADRLLGKIEGVLAMLAQHPLAGRARPELHRELRSFPCGSYVVFYLPQSDGIEVVRVLSGFLDLDQVEFQ
ncbi:Death on curing protein [Beijerinckiaceae bacterium RH AL1]|nr:type II toxin-antitoxin system RelE/ParE family toxin [Beijerinckiaceae bacterium]VVB48061.1 Death on curing protein [Beijerinckiaceae bacterium RH CH11]VVB48138.1 Death on curing protein [Beijerinckiaceae bacterium RH AL8]VVC56203.1 Death on curing protein [Beijerinckiaceae bacterium RH AL1]